MPLTSKELKAINWFKTEHNLKLQLSALAQGVNFTDKETGKSKTFELENIMLQYKDWSEQDQKRRAKERAILKKQEEK